MTFTKQLDEAKYCIETMKKIGTFQNHKIGIINIETDTLTLINGRVCLYREDGSTLTTEYAYNKEIIENNLRKNNFLTTHSTCVCVPKKYVIPFNSKFEKIFGSNNKNIRYMS